MTEKSLLIRNADVLSLDPAVGNPEGVDILVTGSRIAAIGPQLEAPDAEQIDAAGMLAMPGLIDTHRHCWQTAVRGICSDWSLKDYMRGIRFNVATLYEPEDVYVSNYAGLLECLDAGVTTVYDYSHIVNTPEHADAAVEGWKRSGARGIYGYGYNSAPVENTPFPAVDDRDRDAARVKERHFADNEGLVQMGIAPAEAYLDGVEATSRQIRQAREFGLRLTLHANAIPNALGHESEIEELAEAGLLADDMTLVHCTWLSQRDVELLRETGASVSMAPECELGLGMGFPVTGTLLEHGIAPTIGQDTVAFQSPDLFTQMRLVLQVQRAQTNDLSLQQGFSPEKIDLTHAQVLEFVTANAAAAMGKSGEIGSLAPGKEADVVLLRRDDISLAAWSGPLEAIPFHANAGNVDTVLVGGEVRKRAGALVGVDRRAVASSLAEASERILARAQARGALVPDIELDF